MRTGCGVEEQTQARDRLTSAEEAQTPGLSALGPGHRDTTVEELEEPGKGGSSALLLAPFQDRAETKPEVLSLWTICSAGLVLPLRPLCIPSLEPGTVETDRVRP